MKISSSLLGSLSGDEIRASTPPACYLVRSGRNPDVRPLSKTADKRRKDSYEFIQANKSTTNGSPGSGDRFFRSPDPLNLFAYSCNEQQHYGTLLRFHLEQSLMQPSEAVDIVEILKSKVT